MAEVPLRDYSPPPGAMTDAQIDAVVTQARSTGKKRPTYQVPKQHCFYKYHKLYRLWVTQETYHRHGRCYYYFTMDDGTKCGHDDDNYLFTNYWLAHAYYRRMRVEHGLAAAA